MELEIVHAAVFVLPLPAFDADKLFVLTNHEFFHTDKHTFPCVLEVDVTSGEQDFTLFVEELDSMQT